MKGANQHGFTLIETVVAMFIIGITILAFTALFTSSFAGIFMAGNKSENLYKAHQEMENAVPGAGVKNEIAITFDDHIVKVSGSTIIVNKTYGQNNQTVSLTLFLPDK